MTDWDAIIVGGGPAGSAAAISLARAGKHVALFEKTQGPHHKVCGEFISVEAVAMLQSFGIDLPALGSHPITQLALIDQQREALFQLPFQAQSLSRYRLDEALLMKATYNGAALFRGQSVTRMRHQDGRWHIHMSGGNQHVAPALFLATGKHNLNGWPRPGKDFENVIGFKMHFQLTLAQQTALSDRVEVYLGSDGYAGLEPAEDGITNLCMVVTAESYKQSGSWVTMMDQLQAYQPVLSARLKNAMPLWKRPLAIAQIPYGYLANPDENEPPGLFRLGDQMAVIPSFCGDGMAMALQSSIWASQHFFHGSSKTYYRQARCQYAAQIRWAQLATRATRHYFSRNVLLKVLRYHPQLLHHFIRKTRVRGE